MTKAVIHDDVIDKNVLITALSCPSSTAIAELKDGFIKKKKIPEEF